jgi:hypothetical protein
MVITVYPCLSFDYRHPPARDLRNMFHEMHIAPDDLILFDFGLL